GLVAAVVGEAIVAQSVIEMTQQHDVVLERNIRTASAATSSAATAAESTTATATETTTATAAEGCVATAPELPPAAPTPPRRPPRPRPAAAAPRAAPRARPPSAAPLPFAGCSSGSRLSAAITGTLRPVGDARAVRALARTLALTHALPATALA